MEPQRFKFGPRWSGSLRFTGKQQSETFRSELKQSSADQHHGPGIDNHIRSWCSRGYVRRKAHRRVARVEGGILSTVQCRLLADEGRTGQTLKGTRQVSRNSTSHSEHLHPGLYLHYVFQ